MIIRYHVKLFGTRCIFERKKKLMLVSRKRDTDYPTLAQELQDLQRKFRQVEAEKRLYIEQSQVSQRRVVHDYHVTGDTPEAASIY